MLQCYLSCWKPSTNAGILDRISQTIHERKPQTATEKSQYRQEMAHSRNPRSLKKLCCEISSTRGEMGINRQKSLAIGFFYVSYVAGESIPVPTGSLLALYFQNFFILFSLFLHYWIPYLQKNNEKSSDKELRHFDFYRAGMINLTLLARWFLLFTGTVLPSNFYLECFQNF